MNRDDAKKLQQALNATGHDAGLLDGYVGPLTCKASATYLLAEHKDAKVADVAWSHLKYADDDEMIDGIDVSGWQGEIDWKTVSESGICSFAFCKLTEGQTHIQKSAQRNLDGARAWGIPVGGYHFGRSVSDYEKDGLLDATAEAEHFLSVWGTTQPDDLRPVLDVETGFHKDPALHSFNVSWILEWCRVIEESLGKPPIIYTARWAVQSRLAHADNLDELAKFDVWWAEYRSKGLPRKNLSPWKEWKIHQWTGSGTVPGIDAKCDRNRMKKSTLKELMLS
jgi:lysozyme